MELHYSGLAMPLPDTTAKQKVQGQHQVTSPGVVGLFEVY